MIVKGVKIEIMSKYTPLTCILIFFVLYYNRLLGGLYEH